MNKTYMTPEDLKTAIVELFGTAPGGQRKMARALGRHEVTVSRWMSEDAPIEEPIAHLVKMLVEKHRKKRVKQKPAQNIQELF
jgi:hypothetical protein